MEDEVVADIAAWIRAAGGLRGETTGRQIVERLATAFECEDGLEHHPRSRDFQGLLVMMELASAPPEQRIQEVATVSGLDAVRALQA